MCLCDGLPWISLRILAAVFRCSSNEEREIILGYHQGTLTLWGPLCKLTLKCHNSVNWVIRKRTSSTSSILDIYSFIIWLFFVLFCFLRLYSTYSMQHFSLKYEWAKFRLKRFWNLNNQMIFFADNIKTAVSSSKVMFHIVHTQLLLMKTCATVRFCK